MPKDKIKLSDSNTGKMLTIQTATEHLERDVTLIVPSRSGVLVTKEIMEEYIEEVSNNISNIRQPIILSPTQNELEFDGVLNITPYNPSPLVTGLHTATLVQVARDELFTDIVINVTLGPVTTYPLNIGGPSSTYYVRVMYQSDSIVSKWSVPVKFTTIDSTIARPDVSISDEDTQLVGDGSTISISGFSSTAPEEIHVSTTWRIVNPVTDITIWESVNDTVNLVSITIPKDALLENTEYLIKVILYGDISEKSPTGTLLIKTRETFISAEGNANAGVDSNAYVLKSSGGVDYFGEVGIGQLDGTYNYRGEWGINSGRPDKDYVVGEQVTYNDVLYRCIKTHTNVTPGTDATTWVVDTRNGLPTG